MENHNRLQTQVLHHPLKSSRGSPVLASPCVLSWYVISVFRAKAVGKTAKLIRFEFDFFDFLMHGLPAKSSEA